jgi:hypothetical protein
MTEIKTDSSRKKGLMLYHNIQLVIQEYKDVKIKS